jgi:hypothetical protein
MLLFQQIYTNVKAAADELNQLLPGAGDIPPIKQQTQIAHKQKMLNTLKTIFERHQLADEKADQSELIQDLRTYLETVWQDINGTLLSYTALPFDSLTRLHIDIANALATRINQTAKQPVSALKLLMPTLEGLTDPVEGYPNLAPYQDEKDQWVIPEVEILKVLTTHIQSDRGTYLVPIQHLARAFPVIKEEKQEAKHEEKYNEVQEQEEIRVDTRNDLLKRNPYGFVDDAKSYELSKDEITRLQNYSRLTQELTNAEENLVALTQKDVSFLGYLNRFINALHLNSVAGIGSEENAGFAAYAAIINFNEYYRLLPDAERDKIPEDLRKAIDKLLGFASDKEKNKDAVKTIQTCIAIRRGDIEKEKRPHEALLATLGGAQVESLLINAKEQIEHTRIALQDAIDKNNLNGADPLGIKRSLLHIYGIKPTFSGLADLILITSLNTKEIKELLQDNDIQKSFLNAITNMNDLESISIELTAEKLTAILELTKDALFKKCVGNQLHNFIAWVFSLSPEKIEPIVRFNIDAIHAFNVSRLARFYSELVARLNQEQRAAVFKGEVLVKIMQDHAMVEELSHDAQAEIMKYITNDNSLSMEQRSIFREICCKRFMQNPSTQSEKMLVEVIKFNPKLFGQYLSESKETPAGVGKKFALWLQYLPAAECKILIQQNLEVIKNKIDVGATYARALEYVNDEKLKIAFDSGLRGTIIHDLGKLREFFKGTDNLQSLALKKFKLFSLLVSKNAPDDEIKKVFSNTLLGRGSCMYDNETADILVRLSTGSDPTILQRGIPKEYLAVYLLTLGRLNILCILANFNENTLAFYFKDANAIKSFFDAERQVTGGNDFGVYFVLKQYARKAKIPFPELQKIECLPQSLSDIYELVKVFPVNARMDVLIGILSMSPDMKFDQTARRYEYLNFFDLFPEADQKNAAKIFQDKTLPWPLSPENVVLFEQTMLPMMFSESSPQKRSTYNRIFELFEDRLLPAKGIDGLIRSHNNVWRELYGELSPDNQYKLADYVMTRFKLSLSDLFTILNGRLTPTIDVLLKTWKDAIMPSQEHKGVLQDVSDFIWLCDSFKHKGIDAFAIYSSLADKILPSDTVTGFEWKADQLTDFMKCIFWNGPGYHPEEEKTFLAEFQKQFFSGKIKCATPHDRMAILENLCLLRIQAATEVMEIFMPAYEQDRRGHAMLKGFGRSDYLKELNQTDYQVIKEQEQYALNQVNKGYIRVGVDEKLVYKSGPFSGRVFSGYEPINLSPAELKTFDDVLKPVLNQPRYLTRDELKKIVDITHHTVALAAHDIQSIQRMVRHSRDKPKSRTATVLNELLNQPGGILGVSQSSAAQAASASSSSSSSSNLFSTRSRSNAVDTSPSVSADPRKEHKM